MIKKRFINYDTNNIFMKTRLVIEITNPNNYEETKLYKY